MFTSLYDCETPLMDTFIDTFKIPKIMTINKLRIRYRKNDP